MNYKSILVKLGGLISIMLLMAGLAKMDYKLSPEEKGFILPIIQQVIMSAG